MNHLILHYHIFKNAGTSLDGIFKRIFGDQFKTFDKSDPGSSISPPEVNALIDECKNIKVFSSHQIKFPRPSISNYIPHQVVFIRHPLARIESCYQFEKYKQGILPESMDLEAYVQKHLKTDQVEALIGLQTRVLANNIQFSTGNTKDNLTKKTLDTAYENLLNCDALGIVEHYSKSLELFEIYFQKYFPEFKISDEEKGKRLNVSPKSHGKLEQAVKSLQSQLKPDTYQRLLDQLESDMLLYRKALSIFNDRCKFHNI